MKLFRTVRAVAINLSSESKLTAESRDSYTSLNVISVEHNALKVFSSALK